MLRQVGVDVEADHVAVLRAGGDGFGGVHREAAAEEQVVRVVTADGFRHGAEPGVGVAPQPRAVIGSDRRVRLVRRGRGEAGDIERIPRGERDAPRRGQCFRRRVLLAQQRDEGLLGRALRIAGERAQRQAPAALRAGTGPGQFVVGEVAEQPGIVAHAGARLDHCLLRGLRETRVERIGHAAPVVVAAGDVGVVAGDVDRARVWQPVRLSQRIVAPVADGVEAPGLQPIQRARAPGSQPVLAIDAIQVGRVEIEPAAMVVAHAPAGALVLVAVVTIAVERGPFAAVRRQVEEHELAALDITAATIGNHRVDAEREERVAVGCHQSPATPLLLRVEPAGFGKTWDVQTSAVFILPSPFCLRLLERGLFVRMRGTQGRIGIDFLRPARAAGLAVAIDDASVGGSLQAPAGCRLDPSQQQGLRGLRRRDAEPQRAHRTRIERAFHRGGEQDGPAVVVERHRRRGLHAHGARTRRVQGDHQRLRRSGRQADLRVQVLIRARTVDVDGQRDRPRHRVLHLHVQLVASGPGVRRCHDQRRRGDRFEGVTLQGETVDRLRCAIAAHVIQRDRRRCRCGQVDRCHRRTRMTATRPQQAQATGEDDPFHDPRPALKGQVWRAKVKRGHRDAFARASTGFPQRARRCRVVSGVPATRRPVRPRPWRGSSPACRGRR